jgi:hypothetical protein
VEHAKGWDVDRTDIIQKVTRRLIPFVGICYLIRIPGDGLGLRIPGLLGSG